MLPLILILSVALLSVCIYGMQTAFKTMAVDAEPESAASEEEKAEQQNKIELPIVMYHHILKEQSRLNKYTISPDEFRQDLNYMKDNGYTPISMTDLIAYINEGKPLPERPIMITFDDGYESFHEYAYPMLKEYGYKAILSVIGKYADEYSETDDHHIRYSHSSWEQLKDLQSSGLIEIGNHTYNMHMYNDGRHGCKKKKSESVAAYHKALSKDVGQMQEKCNEHLGIYPKIFTYPFGQICEDALPIIKEMGFEAVLTCQEKINYITDKNQLEHLNRFNRPHGTSLQMILNKAKSGQKKTK